MIVTIARTSSKRTIGRLNLRPWLVPGKRPPSTLFHSGRTLQRRTADVQLKTRHPLNSFRREKSLIKRNKAIISGTGQAAGRTLRQKKTLIKRNKATISGPAQAAPRIEAEAAEAPSFLGRLNQWLNKSRTLPIPRWISPQYVSITYSECFGHSSFLLVAISYYMDDFLTLRTIAVAGSSAMLVFTYFHPHGKVLWLPFKWNLMFIAINGYRVMKVHLDRFFAERLSPLMQDIHDKHFYVMDKVDFARLARLGTVERFRKGEVVVAQGEDNRHVRLVLKGKLNVERDHVITYFLDEGNFISESGLHAGLLLRGKVTSCCSVIANCDEVICLRWNRTELMHLLEVDKSMRRSIKAVMSWDIVSKLKSQRTLLKSGVIPDTEQWNDKAREQTLDRYKAILKNMLKHPRYLNKRKEELHKYRDIHHVDDEQHQRALAENGWTMEEFEAGSKDGQIDEDLEDEVEKDRLKWYMEDFKLRALG